MSATAHKTVLRCVAEIEQIEAAGEQAELTRLPKGGHGYRPKTVQTREFGSGVIYETDSAANFKNYPHEVRYLGVSIDKMGAHKVRAVVRVILMHAVSTRRADARTIGDLRRALSAQPTPEPEVTPRWSFMRAMILPFAAGVGACLLALALNGVIK